MALPDNTLPPNPRNDAVAILHAGSTRISRSSNQPTPPSQPMRPLAHRGIIAVVIAAATFPVILLGHDLIVVLAAMIGFFASLTALVAAGSMTRRSIGNKNAGPPQGMARSVKFLVLAGVLFGTNSWACVQTNCCWRDIDRTIVTGSLLHQIARGVETYRENYGVAPTGIEQLVASDLYSERWLVLPTDKDGWRDFAKGVRVPSSIVFIPAAAAQASSPKTLLAYERGPWSSMGLRLFPEHRHSVVFADGSVDKLTPSGLAAALNPSPTTRP